jgi:MATE family multidrug resistance protein
VPIKESTATPTALLRQSVERHRDRSASSSACWALAAAAAAVPITGRIGGVPETNLDELGVFPYILACVVVMMSIGATAASALVGPGKGKGKAVLRSGMTGTASAVALWPLLVGGVGSSDGLGLPGAGIAMRASSTINTPLAHLQLRRTTVLVGRPPGLGRPRPREVLHLA